MTLFALIGAKGLYLLFIWLISAAGGAWIADRKGYGERVGLTFGLLLTALGLLIVLLLPGRPGSLWKEEGWWPRRSRSGDAAWGGPPPAGEPPAGSGPAGGGPSAGSGPAGGGPSAGAGPSATPPGAPPPAQASPPDGQ